MQFDNPNKTEERYQRFIKKADSADIFDKTYEHRPGIRAAFVFFAYYGLTTAIGTLVSFSNGVVLGDLENLALAGSAIGLGSAIGYLRRHSKASKNADK